MRAHQVFTRYKGAPPPGGVVLGADPADPNASPTLPGPPGLQDTVVGVRTMTVSGSAIKRMGVSYKGQPAAIALSAQMWFYETATERWYALEAAKNITPDRITFFDVPATLENTSSSYTSGTAVQAYLYVADGATPAGRYDFGFIPSIA